MQETPDNSPAGAPYAVTSAQHYFSREIAELEEQKLWPNTWLIACREQEVSKSGDFVTFDIGRESIVIVRTTEGQLKAYYNVCQHRGRRLKSGCGNTGKGIHCPFHAWRWNLDGALTYRPDNEDWDGYPLCSPEEVALNPVRLETWAGWVWVSMAESIVPLTEYLAPIPEILKNFEFEHCRIAWHKTIVFPCNWKLALDAFNEGYHVEGTHPQILKDGRPRSLSKAFGEHGWFGYPTFAEKFDDKTAAKGGVASPQSVDFRKALLCREEEQSEWLHALTSEYSIEAAKRLLTILPETASFAEVTAKHRELHRQVVEEAGAKWPQNLTREDQARAGTDWHMFPNTICLPHLDGALWYRARPNGDDVGSCLFDAWWIQRFPEGQEPPVTHDFYAKPEDFKGQNPFLEQDFANLIACQAGAPSRGFKGLKTNPVQEVAVSNFHRALRKYLFAE